MLKTLRIALMWLLAFAVPVQGFAATTMLFCMGAHYPAEVAAEASSHHHEGMHDHHDHAEQQASAGSHDHSSPHQTAGKCSACSACCMSVAIPTPAIRFEALTSSSELVVVELSAHAVFLTDGPERPPRNILA